MEKGATSIFTLVHHPLGGWGDLTITGGRVLLIITVGQLR